MATSSLSTHVTETENSGLSSSYRGTNPMCQGGPPSWPHLNLSTFQRPCLQTALPWGVGLQHIHFGRGTNISSIAKKQWKILIFPPSRWKWHWSADKKKHSFLLSHGLLLPFWGLVIECPNNALCMILSSGNADWMLSQSSSNFMLFWFSDSHTQPKEQVSGNFISSMFKYFLIHG